MGVNNRDLRTLAVSLETSLALAPAIPDEVVAVAESGIRTGADLRMLRDAGFDAFLVGEQLMAAPDPGEALARVAAGRGGAAVSRLAGQDLRDHQARGRAVRRRGRGRRARLRLLAHEPAQAWIRLGRPRSRATLPRSVLRVGVFVDAPRDEMARIADEVGLDMLQLHGDEPPEALAGLPRRVIKAVRVGKGFKAEDALRYADKAAGILVDTRSPGETQFPGGTGVPFDWSLVAGLARRVPFLMLAGGLSPDNVADGHPRGAAPRGRRLERRRGAAGAQGPAQDQGLRRGRADRGGGERMSTHAGTARHVGVWPDAAGHFGPYGGRYVPETLMEPLHELEARLRGGAARSRPSTPSCGACCATTSGGRRRSASPRASRSGSAAAST